MSFILTFLRPSIGFLVRSFYVSLNMLLHHRTVIVLFRSYLTGRRHKVVVNNEGCDFRPVTSGVPQG